MGIKLPGDNTGKSEKLRMEELKSETKKYESNAKFFTEALNLAKEALKAYQKFKDAEMAETEWKGKSDLEAKKVEKALIDLEKIRMQSVDSTNKLEVQKDHWATIKYILHSEYDIIKDMPVSDERIKMVDQINTMLENLNKYQPGK